MRLIVCCMITLLYFSIMADYIQNQDRRTSMTVTDNLYGDIVLMSVVCDVANSPLLHLYISHGHASLIAMFRGLLPAFLILRIIWCRSFVWPDVFLVSKCRYHYLNLNLFWVPDKRTLLSSCRYWFSDFASILSLFFPGKPGQLVPSQVPLLQLQKRTSEDWWNGWCGSGHPSVSVKPLRGRQH